MTKEEFNARVQWRIANALEGIEDMMFVLAYLATRYAGNDWQAFDAHIRENGINCAINDMNAHLSWKEDVKHYANNLSDSFPSELFETNEA